MDYEVVTYDLTGKLAEIKKVKRAYIAILLGCNIVLSHYLLNPSPQRKNYGHLSIETEYPKIKIVCYTINDSGLIEYGGGKIFRKLFIKNFDRSL